MHCNAGAGGDSGGNVLVQPVHGGHRLPLLRDARLVRPLARDAQCLCHASAHQRQFWRRQRHLPAGRARPRQLRPGVSVVTSALYMP